jgi:hypothetical protein
MGTGIYIACWIAIILVITVHVLMDIKRDRKPKADPEANLLAVLNGRFAKVTAHRDYKAGDVIFVDKQDGTTYDN